MFERIVAQPQLLSGNNGASLQYVILWCHYAIHIFFIQINRAFHAFEFYLWQRHSTQIERFIGVGHAMWMDLP